MVDSPGKHHFVKSSHFSENHQIIQNLQNLLGPKRAIRFKTLMPVLSETKQLLHFRLELVVCNQIVVTHPPFHPHGQVVPRWSAGGAVQHRWRFACDSRVTHV